MNSWAHQIGYPVLKIREIGRDDAENWVKFSVEQERFFASPEDVDHSACDGQ